MATVIQCGPGTTANIDEIFLGRCYQYKEISSGKLLKPQYVAVCFSSVKPVISNHSKIGKMKIFKTGGSLIKVKSIAECSK